MNKKWLHSEVEDQSEEYIAMLNNDEKAKMCANYAKEIKQLRRKLRTHEGKRKSDKQGTEESVTKGMNLAFYTT